jgi:hypothetical protein
VDLKSENKRRLEGRTHGAILIVFTTSLTYDLNSCPEISKARCTFRYLCSGIVFTFAFFDTTLSTVQLRAGNSSSPEAW